MPVPAWLGSHGAPPDQHTRPAHSINASPNRLAHIALDHPRPLARPHKTERGSGPGRAPATRARRVTFRPAQAGRYSGGADTNGGSPVASPSGAMRTWNRSARSVQGRLEWGPLSPVEKWATVSGRRVLRRPGPKGRGGAAPDARPPRGGSVFGRRPCEVEVFEAVAVAVEREALAR
jgi:hypothetical protein